MGRIRKQAFVLSLTDEEITRLNRMVKQSGLSRETFIRKLISGHSPQPLPTDEINKILDTLRDIAASYRELVAFSKSCGTDIELITMQFKELCSEILKLTSLFY